MTWPTIIVCVAVPLVAWWVRRKADQQFREAVRRAFRDDERDAW